MKCSYCDNDIVKKYGMPRIACQSVGCISFGIKPGSKLFQTLICGKSPEEVEQHWKARQQKGAATKRNNGYFDDKSNNAYSVDFWVKHGFTEAEAKSKLKAKASKSIATKRNNGYFDDKSNNPYSKAFGEKNGLTSEEATIRIRSKNHNCAEFWIKRGFNRDEAIRNAAESADTNSLIGKIAKYGNELGTQYYSDTCKKMSQNWNPKSASHQKFGSSIEANKFFLRLYKYLRKIGYKRDDFMFALNRGEMFLKQNDKIYFYDFCFKPLKIIIEYNGEHVHPNIAQMNEDERSLWKHAYTKQSADVVHDYDNNKKVIAEQLGFKCLAIWSKDPNGFNKAINFIKEHHDSQNHQT